MRHNLRWIPALGIAAITLATACGCSGEANGNNPASDPKAAVWELSDQLVDSAPHTVDKVEQITGVTLKNGPNPRRNVYSGNTVTPQGVPVTKVIARVGGGAGWGYTSVTLDESIGCITVDDAKQHYPDLSRPPQPADTSAEPSYLMTQKITGETYVRLGFGRHTGCLTTLGAQNGPDI